MHDIIELKRKCCIGSASFFTTYLSPWIKRGSVFWKDYSDFIYSLWFRHSSWPSVTFWNAWMSACIYYRVGFLIFRWKKRVPSFPVLSTYSRSSHNNCACAWKGENNTVMHPKLNHIIAVTRDLELILVPCVIQPRVVCLERKQIHIFELLFLEPCFFSVCFFNFFLYFLSLERTGNCRAFNQRKGSSNPDQRVSLRTSSPCVPNRGR